MQGKHCLDIGLCLGICGQLAQPFQMYLQRDMQKRQANEPKACNALQLYELPETVPLAPALGPLRAR